MGEGSESRSSLELIFFISLHGNMYETKNPWHLERGRYNHVTYGGLNDSRLGRASPEIIHPPFVTGFLSATVKVSWIPIMCVYVTLTMLQ